MHRIIFLDIDGVLNCEHGISKLYNDAGQVTVRTRTTCTENTINFHALLDMDVNIKIVISSTWRIGFKRDKNRMGETWNDLLGDKIASRIIGVTPRSDGIRGSEIKAWIKAHDYIDDQFKYIIIDDDTDILKSQKDHFVHTSYKFGFEEKHIEEAYIKLL